MSRVRLTRYGKRSAFELVLKQRHGDAVVLCRMFIDEESAITVVAGLAVYAVTSTLVFARTLARW